jgi:hypothetical protein
MKQGGFDSIDDYLKMHLGYTSIFDVKHSFTTNIVPIPYFNFDFGHGLILNTWYVKQCNGRIVIPLVEYEFDM